MANRVYTSSIVCVIYCVTAVIMTYTLFVGGIVPSASHADIEAEFKKFGRCTASFPARVRF